MKSILYALISRGSVYLFGFSALLLISAALPNTEFGRLNFIQSAAELALIFFTLGSSLLYTRIGAKRGAKTTYSPSLRTVAVGSPIAAVVLFAILKDSVTPGEYLLIFTIAATQSVNLLIMSALRGEGSSFLINYDAAVRGAITSTVLVFFSFLLFKPDIYQILIILLIGNLTVFALAWRACHQRSKVSRGPLKNKRIHSAKYFGSSLAQFFIRKFDIIIVSYLYGFAYAGEYKIAFLFSESIFQFAQAFVNTKIMILNNQNATVLSKAKILRELTILILLCTLFMLVAYVMYAAYIGKPLINEQILILTAYFAWRSLISFHEVVLSMRLPSKELLVRTLVELGVRFIVIITMCVVLKVDFIYTFVPIAIFEYYFYHHLMRYRFQFEKIIKAGLAR